MYVNILKKDLKRKKTMNFILLLFTVLAATFVSSGLNNVITVMNGTDYFLDKAGIGDYIIFTQKGDGGVEDILRTSDQVKGYKKETCYWIANSDMTVKGERPKTINNTVVLQTLQHTGFHYFLEDNEELKKVSPGEIYVPASFMKANHLVPGDSLRISLQGTDQTFRIAGKMKDALLGSEMMGNTRLIISEEDSIDFRDNEKLIPYRGCVFSVETGDDRSLAAKLAGNSNVLISLQREVLLLCYVMEMIMAMIVLSLSVCLVIVSFVLLKFVITFSINEEYREIGIMKAIGIRNRKIRSLYMIKYTAIAVTGGAVGCLLGIPLGGFLMKSVSEKMVLGNDQGGWTHLAGALSVTLVMILFSYRCTGKIKRATPVDAIRNGQTGERFRKKSFLSLGKSRLGHVFFLAVNDIFSAPRRFVTLILPFFLCSVFVFGIVMVRDTIKSDRLVTALGKKSHVYITDSEIMRMNWMSQGGEKELLAGCEQMERDLKTLNMPGRVSADVWYKYNVTSGGRTTSVTFQQNQRVKAEAYTYMEGSPPQNADEIAVTPLVSEELGAGIGDRVTIDFVTEKRECIIVGLFQTLNQLGAVSRLHEDAPTSMAYANALTAMMIDFDGEPTDREIRERIEKIKAFYHVEDVMDGADYCESCIRTGDTMDIVSRLLLLITCLVVILVDVLVERSFLSTEKTQVALLKALGFRETCLMRWQVARLMIAALAAEVMAVILTYPVTKLWCDPIWRMMGIDDMAYVFRPVSLLVIYPGVILAVHCLSVFMTALYTRKIKGTDVMNIE